MGEMYNVIKYQELILTSNLLRLGIRKPNQHTPGIKSLFINEKLWAPGEDRIKSVKMGVFKDVALKRTMAGFFLGRMRGLNDLLFHFFLIS